MWWLKIVGSKVPSLVLQRNSGKKKKSWYINGLFATKSLGKTNYWRRKKDRRMLTVSCRNHYQGLSNSVLNNVLWKTKSRVPMSILLPEEEEKAHADWDIRVYTWAWHCSCLCGVSLLVLHHSALLIYINCGFRLKNKSMGLEAGSPWPGH